MYRSLKISHFVLQSGNTDTEQDSSINVSLSSGNQDRVIIMFMCFVLHILHDSVKCHFMFVCCNVHQGPVVQSIVSLKNSLRAQLVKCFMTL